MKKQKPNKFVLGVTGSFASGKSTVARLFAGRQAQVIDADRIAHTCLNSSKGLKEKLVKVFGAKILSRRGVIQRKELGKIVFSDKAQLKKLNRIMHPLIKRIIHKQIADSKKKIVILDAALIIETGLKSCLDKLVVVRAGLKEQLFRAKKKFSLGSNDALSRIQFQSSIRAKTRLADFVIDNRGSLKQTKKQVAEIRRKLWKS